MNLRSIGQPTGSLVKQASAYAVTIPWNDTFRGIRIPGELGDVSIYSVRQGSAPCFLMNETVTVPSNLLPFQYM